MEAVRRPLLHWFRKNHMNWNSVWRVCKAQPSWAGRVRSGIALFHFSQKRVSTFCLMPKIPLSNSTEVGSDNACCCCCCGGCCGWWWRGRRGCWPLTSWRSRSWCCCPSPCSTSCCTQMLRCLSNATAFMILSYLEDTSPVTYYI